LANSNYVESFTYGVYTLSSCCFWPVSPFQKCNT